MKKVLMVLLAGMLLNTALAKEDEEDYTVVLPEAAQACVLPAATDSISPDATYEQLVAAKGQMTEFQAALGGYRDCLKNAEENGGELTAGNKQALVASHNYSVDMEERVAERFNEAVRSYKERTAAQ